MSDIDVEKYRSLIAGMRTVGNDVIDIDDVVALLDAYVAVRNENKRLIIERNECDDDLEDVTERYNALLNAKSGISE